MEKTNDLGAGNIPTHGTVICVQHSVLSPSLAFARRLCQIPLSEVVVKLICSALTIVGVLIAVDANAASDYRFDPVHTQIFFSVSHVGYSHSTGRLAVKNGFFSFDDKDWSAAKIDATIDIASLDMGNTGWSDKLKSAYFDTSTYPTAHYVSKSVEKKDDRTGVVHGALTLLGRTVPVDLQVTFNRAGADGYTMRYVAGFSATANFKRSAFGMTRSDKDIGDDIAIHIEAEGIRDGDAQKQVSPTEHR